MGMVFAFWFMFLCFVRFSAMFEMVGLGRCSFLLGLLCLMCFVGFSCCAPMYAVFVLACIVIVLYVLLRVLRVLCVVPPRMYSCCVCAARFLCMCFSC